MSASDEAVLTPEPGTHVIQTATAQIWIGSDDIVRVVCAPGSVHRAADARENTDAIPPEKRRGRPVLVDIRQGRSVEREAREVYRDPTRHPDLVAVAILIGSPLSRAIGNFFVGLSTLPVPTRLFTSPTEAVAWLKAQRR